jgi:hypothetical protein
MENKVRSEWLRIVISRFCITLKNNLEIKPGTVATLEVAKEMSGMLLEDILEEQVGSRCNCIYMACLIIF